MIVINSRMKFANLLKFKQISSILFNIRHIFGCELIMKATLLPVTVVVCSRNWFRVFYLSIIMSLFAITIVCWDMCNFSKFWNKTICDGDHLTETPKAHITSSNICYLNIYFKIRVKNINFTLT